MTVADLTEAELVARIRSRLAPPPPWLIVGIGDDAAVVEPERGRLEVVTVDALIDGVHVDRAIVPPDAIGHRALAVNLSDLAAMGAMPRFALVSFALPAGLTCGEFDAIVGGLAGLAARHRLHVIGGNLTRSPGPLMIDVSVTGTLKRRQVLTRGGARPGDEIYVTGSIGGAAAGLEMRRARAAGGSRGDLACVSRYGYPAPRLRTGVLLARNRAATACMDLSDGLGDGIRQIAEASGVGVELDAAALPIEPGARAWFQTSGRDATAAALASDDYELVFTVRPRNARRLRAVDSRTGPPLTRIGVCTRERDLVLHRMGPGGPRREPLAAGYGHFR